MGTPIPESRRAGRGSARRVGAALFLAAAILPATWAAFPGSNGKIAFASNPGGNFDVFVVNPDGTGAVNLTSHPAEDLDPAWSPDGTKIVFTSDRDGELAIYVMNADGAGVQKLTDGPDRFPAWSPDGTKISFSRFSEARFDYDVWVANADGSLPVNLTPLAKDDLEPVWSPDGTKIAFTSFRTGNGEIFVMGADGSGPVNRTNAAGTDQSPDWSPEGTRIAFSSSRDGTSGIWVMNADGSGQTDLSALGDIGPAWSPDGMKIAFSSSRDGNLELYVMEADGSGAARLTSDDPYALRDDVLPDWQPLAPQEENRPPVADAGRDLTTECSSSDGAVVLLDGSASSDPDSTPGTNDDIVLFEWFEDFGLPTEAFLGVGETLEVALPLGAHAITLRVTDRGDLNDTDEVEVQVVDTTAPELSVSVTPDVLWPPKNQMVAVHAVVTLSDTCGGGSFVLASVLSSEPEDSHGAGDGHTAPDIQGAEVGTPDLDVELRAERAGTGSGRTYTLTYMVTDAAGNSGSAIAIVRVPHDRSAKGTASEKDAARAPSAASGTRPRPR